MLESGSVVTYPGIPMARFGLIPAEYGGGNKYRVIWAPSRMVTLVGRDKTMTIPMYAGPYAIEPVGDYWILEGWRSPLDICGPMTAEKWNANPMLLNTGPFPARGDYVRHETLACNPSDANIEKLITWIEEGRNRRAVDNFQACQSNMETSLADKKSKRDALIRNAMRPFNATDAMVGSGTRQRSTKTTPILKSREEAGLPDHGQTVALRGPRQFYEVPQEEGA